MDYVFVILIFLYYKKFSPRFLQAEKELLLSFLQFQKDYKERSIYGTDVLTAVTMKDVMSWVVTARSW